MHRDIGMKLHQYRAKNISFYNTSVLKFAMFCSFHNKFSKIFYFYRLFFDEFITEIYHENFPLLSIASSEKSIV